MLPISYSARMVCFPLTPSQASRTLTSIIDKTIKLWKVFEKQIRMVAENNHSNGFVSPGTGPSGPPLRLPKMTTHDSITAAVPRKVYANAHAYHINSISVNSDQETYISADDLRINLWNLNISDQSFSECSQSVPQRTRSQYNRYRRYQTGQHGGVDRSHNGRRIPSCSLQSLHVL